MVYQVEDLTIVKVEVEEGEMMRSDLPGISEVKEEVPVDVTAENPSKNPEKNVNLSLNCKVEDKGENLITVNVHPELDSTDPSYNQCDYEESSPEHSQITSTDQKESEMFQCGVCGKEFTKSLEEFTQGRSSIPVQNVANVLPRSQNLINVKEVTQERSCIHV
ncbi:unnamed protein product [Ranitomeya imitator]|uniref:Uncharacterized protein n=1 Tax=Ranitomeya imitator TaxID=111125 RepID=A0ABN9LWX9_9NEOB|nr:unnamed protein product [Ranitomeya imitator]